MKKKFTYGTYAYEYELVREERKTLSLTVRPDLSLIIKAPIVASEERIEQFLKRKWVWLQKQVDYFGKFKRKKYQKEYISGESFLYLGRQYQLIVKESDQNKVVLSRGKITLFTSMFAADKQYNKLLIQRWYRSMTKLVFSERFEKVWKLFDYKKMPALTTRSMDKRWGSFLNSDKILLNPRLIGASKECIDYVICHELCHVRYRDHNTNFYKLLEQKCPKWEKVKDKLENYLGNA